MSITRRRALEVLALGVLSLTGCAEQQVVDSTPSQAPTKDATHPVKTTPTQTSPADPLPSGVVNALIIGTDSREKTDFGGNTDVLMLAQISADRKRLTLVSIARDTYIDGHKANAYYPAGGMDLLRSKVSAVFGGIDIHVTAHTNFNGFINITRALKGIWVRNKHANSTTVLSTGRVVDFPEGDIKLENTDALIYARERKALPQGDLDRAERHRALIIGISKGLQAWHRNSPGSFRKLAQTLAAQCQFNGIEKDRVPDLITPLMQVDADNVTSLMLPLSGFDMVDGQSVNVIDEPQLQALVEGLKNGDVRDYVAQFGTDYTPG